jgi:hypothetical protein
MVSFLQTLSAPKALGTMALGVQVKTGDKVAFSLCLCEPWRAVALCKGVCVGLPAEVLT